MIRALCLLLTSHLALTVGYYLPGVMPHSFEDKESVKLYVSKLTSTKTQVPYDYYSLPFCAPHKVAMQTENIGEILSGDRIENSVYKVDMKTQKSCAVACGVKLTGNKAQKFRTAIKDDYRAHWIIDNLPVGSYVTDAEGNKILTRGIPIGFAVKDAAKPDSTGKLYLYNHFRIILQYHDNTESESEMELSRDFASPVSPAKIVGFRVQPLSVKHTYNDKEFRAGKTTLNTCNLNIQPSADDTNYQTLVKNELVIFTYDVFWEASNIEWSRRWDVYIDASTPNDKVHYFAITNSILIVFFMSVMIAMILVRALKKDIAKYNDPVALEEAKEESGWKLVHGDVFRPPAINSKLLSVFVGSGVQLLLMTISTLTFCVLGLLSPDNRGSLGTGLVFLFVFMGSFAGFYSSRVYKMFRGTDWKGNTILTAFFFPSVVFGVFFIINLALFYEGSSGALPFTTLFTLLFLWLCVSVPLVFLGSFYGYKKETEAFPVRTNQIPRQIPAQPWYLNEVITCLICGVLPFAAVSVEVSYIMSALWLHQIYYIFGFLFLVMVVLVLICGEVSILMCYFQLKFEDYQWWWRSFLTGGSCAGYLFLYALWYNLTSLDMTGSVAILIYFGYMFLISFAFFLITGTIGFFSCLWFNWKIYGSIKVD